MPLKFTKSWGNESCSFLDTPQSTFKYTTSNRTYKLQLCFVPDRIRLFMNHELWTHCSVFKWTRSIFIVLKFYKLNILVVSILENFETFMSLLLKSPAINQNGLKENHIFYVISKLQDYF